MIRALLAVPMLAFAVAGVTAPAHAQSIRDISCLVNHYNPGPQYSDEIIRSWIPESFVIEGHGNGHRFRGGNRNENNSRIEEVIPSEGRVLYKIIVNSADDRGNYVSLRFNIYFFTTNGRVSIETDSVGQYSPLGSASGSCAVL